LISSSVLRIPVGFLFVFLASKTSFLLMSTRVFRPKSPKRGIEVRQTLQSKVHGGGHGRLQKRSEMFGGRETIAKSLPPPK